MPRTIYSFVADRGSRFSYQGWHLAHSLVQFCDAAPNDIHIQCTPRADRDARELFEKAGFSTHSLIPFGDEKYCNKLAQIENLPCGDAEIVVLLDTDTIAVSDLRPLISDRVIRAKIVDAANPPIECLQEIANLASLDAGDVCATDSGDDETFVGNCNGGMYAIPAHIAERLSIEWQRWAYWLLEHPEPLRRFSRAIHVDQVSFWMALRSAGFPFETAASNLNYFTHFAAPRTYLDDSQPIALLHYHNQLDVLGKIKAIDGLSHDAEMAISRANEQIGKHFNNRLFWEFRYEHFPERGSGVGSRGDNLLLKKSLLIENGIENAGSILDVGCGDLEIIKALRLRDYTGVDMSPLVIERAKEILPRGQFVLGLQPETPSAEFVLCLEVLIHQHSRDEYDRIVAFASERTARSLIISGYEESTAAMRENSMVFFHEPVRESLNKTGRFRTITEVGRHTDVVIYRCEV